MEENHDQEEVHHEEEENHRLHRLLFEQLNRLDSCQWDVVQEILEQQPQAAQWKDNDHWTPLFWVVYHDSPCLDMVQRILHLWPGATADRDDPGGGLALHWACAFHGHEYDLIQLLVEHAPETVRVAAVSDGLLPLHDACRCESVSLETVQLLVWHYPQATRTRDNEGRLPIDHARQNNNISGDVIQWLEDIENLGQTYELQENMTQQSQARENID